MKIKITSEGEVFIDIYKFRLWIYQATNGLQNRLTLIQWSNWLHLVISNKIQ